MKTTELIEKLNGLYKISAKVAYGEIKITRVSAQPYDCHVLFSLPVDAWSILDGVFYSDNLWDTTLVVIGQIANLLDEYVKTPPKDRQEPKYYHFFSTAPILADSNKYLAINSINGKYVLTCKNPLLKHFDTVFTQAEKNNMEALGLLVGFEPEEIKSLRHFSQTCT